MKFQNEIEIENEIDQTKVGDQSESVADKRLPSMLLHLFLIRRDQITLSVMLILLMIGLSFSVWHRSQILGGLIDIDRARPLSADFKVDINSAEWPEIVNLPGIGVKLAREIVQHREQQGPYETFEQLKDVRGIGDAKLNGIKPYLLAIQPVTEPHVEDQLSLSTLPTSDQKLKTRIAETEDQSAD